MLKSPKVYQNLGRIFISMVQLKVKQDLIRSCVEMSDTNTNKNTERAWPGLRAFGHIRPPVTRELNINGTRMELEWHVN